MPDGLEVRVFGVEVAGGIQDPHRRFEVRGVDSRVGFGTGRRRDRGRTHSAILGDRARVPGAEAAQPAASTPETLWSLIVWCLMNTLVGAKQELLLSRLGDDASGRIIMTLLTTARQIDAACAVLLADYALSEGRLAALLAIADTPGITPGALATRVDVTRATVTGLIDGLERQALVSRGGDPTDRRSLSLTLTPAGDKLLTALTPQYAQWLGALGDGLSTEDQRVLLRALGVIQRNLGDDTPMQ